MTRQNHVDGEIWVNEPGKTVPIQMPALENDSEWFKVRVPVEPTDLDYRTAALKLAVTAGGSKVAEEWILARAKSFEKYLRGEAA